MKAGVDNSGLKFLPHFATLVDIYFVLSHEKLMSWKSQAKI